MVIALLVLQAVGFVVLYLLLRRAVMRRMNASDMAAELHTEVAALIAELNGTTERNVALLEDGVRRIHELLGSVDGGAGQEAPRAQPPAAGAGGTAAERLTPAERRAQVLRLRRSGMSNAAIVDQLATSPGEVELIVSLAEGVPDQHR